MNPATMECSFKTQGQCPSGFDDCSVEVPQYVNLDNLVLDCDGCRHTHNEIIARAPSGYGRELIMGIKIGARTISGTTTFRYKPPHVTELQTPDTGFFDATGNGGAVRFLGSNFGYGEEGLSQYVSIRIGSEYDSRGVYCATDDRCMKPCRNATWHRVGDSASGGHPYLSCIPPQDVAGYKNISVTVAGQTDDCSRNKLLCANPRNWPKDRRPRDVSLSAAEVNEEVKRAQRGTLLNGFLSTCGSSSNEDQSYAKLGELCSQRCDDDKDRQQCQDERCTEVVALAGSWRLDLDLSFACDAEKPCQSSIAKTVKNLKERVFERLYDDLRENTRCEAYEFNTTCPDADQRHCGEKDSVFAGQCTFRRWKEARRALGKYYWPWTCPDVDIKNSPPTDKDFENCRDASGGDILISSKAIRTLLEAGACAASLQVAPQMDRAISASVENAGLAAATWRTFMTSNG